MQIPRHPWLQGRRKLDVEMRQSFRLSGSDSPRAPHGGARERRNTRVRYGALLGLSSDWWVKWGGTPFRI